MIFSLLTTILICILVIAPIYLISKKFFKIRSRLFLILLSLLIYFIIGIFIVYIRVLPRGYSGTPEISDWLLKIVFWPLFGFI